MVNSCRKKTIRNFVCVRVVIIIMKEQEEGSGLILRTGNNFMAYFSFSSASLTPRHRQLRLCPDSWLVIILASSSWLIHPSIKKKCPDERTWILRRRFLSTSQFYNLIWEQYENYLETCIIPISPSVVVDRFLQQASISSKSRIENRRKSMFVQQDHHDQVIFGKFWHVVGFTKKKIHGEPYNISFPCV